jgi:hypothetical protein
MSVGTAEPPLASPPPGEAGKAGAKWLLAVCCVAQFMVILDLSIVNVALPSIQSDLASPRPICSGSSTPTRSRSPAS